jgi:hypothetical protein
LKSGPRPDKVAETIEDDRGLAKGQPLRFAQNRTPAGEEPNQRGRFEEEHIVQSGGKDDSIVPRILADIKLKNYCCVGIDRK